LEDKRQTKLIKDAWKDSDKIYGYRKLHDDLCDQGETCCPNRVARLARLAGIKAQIGYKRRQTTDLVLLALLMAVCRRNPSNNVLVHSDQGSQFTSIDWASFLKAHNLRHSMSRRGNCHDNAVAESFFNLIKRERVRRRTYKTRDDARRDVFDYIEMFYNPKRKHANNGLLSPVDFERQQQMKPQGV